MVTLGCPKPTQAIKKKMHQYVYIRFECGCYYGPGYRVGAPTECAIHARPVEKLYAVGMTYLTEHQVLVDLLDAICSKIVCRRDGYQCVLCKSREDPQCGHVIVRGKWGTRFYLRNMYCQCSACNIRHGKAGQAHYFFNYFLGKWGQEEWLKMCEMAETKRDGKDWTVPELRALLESYEKLWDRLQSLAVFDDDTLAELGFFGVTLKGKRNEQK